MTISASATIHPTAIIADGASIADGVVIGPYCVIGAHVKLASGVRLHSHVVVDGHTEIGEQTEIYPFASLGTAPQDLKFHGEPSRLVIGKRNKIREHVTMNPGTEGGGMLTQVGDDCLFMMSSHVAHDCMVGNRVILANCATLAGHVTVGDFAIIGGLSAVHQFVRIGHNAMVGGMSGVESDVIPYGLVKGERASLHGLNLVGMDRRGYTRDDVNKAREAYTGLFHGQGNLSDRVEATATSHSGNQVVVEMVEFIRNKSKHGLCQPKLEQA